MFDLFEKIEKVARSGSSVLIRGESGTGKELVARAIHSCGSRSGESFNAINCAMLTRELANSELFGHIKGAFTGATTDHTGYFEASDGGTLFLDEIAELPLDVQSRLLRVVQEKTITRVGSTKAKTVNVRLVSATHRALRQEVNDGRFRRDLMYRVRVVPIFLPRLTERDLDIEIIAWQFINEFNKISHRTIEQIAPEVIDAFYGYSWPGNIRELRNNIEYAFVIGDGLTLNIDELPPELQGKEVEEEESIANDFDYQEEEKIRIYAALSKNKGRKGKAADELGMSRSTFWRKLKQYQIS